MSRRPTNSCCSVSVLTWSNVESEKQNIRAKLLLIADNNPGFTYNFKKSRPLKDDGHSCGFPFLVFSLVTVLNNAHRINPKVLNSKEPSNFDSIFECLWK
jgi:hypothetical protein